MIKLKEEVFDWFHNLDSVTRIDFICTLIRLCNPWELRLFGSCVEHAAGRDCSSLRDFEAKANDPNELQYLAQKLFQDEGHEIRSKLIMSMCLLHTRPNTSCTRVIYELLSVLNKHKYEFHTLINDSLVEDLRLLLMIASHHPAFSFNQHREFITQLEALTESFGTPTSSTCQMKNAQCQTDDLIPIINSHSQVYALFN